MTTRIQMNRRRFLGSLGALAVTPTLRAQPASPIPVLAINHMTLRVSDPTRSVEWYQELFGLPIAARQANTIVLRIGDGPQFMAIGGNPSTDPSIDHLCLSVEGFEAAELTRRLRDHGATSSERHQRSGMSCEPGSRNHVPQPTIGFGQMRHCDIVQWGVMKMRATPTWKVPLERQAERAVSIA